MFCAAFLKLQFGFVIFWQKNIGAKAACKMLMTLTKKLNFVHFLQAVFLSGKINTTLQARGVEQE